MLDCVLEACYFPRCAPRHAPCKDLADHRHRAIQVQPSPVKNFAYTLVGLQIDFMLCLHVSGLLPLNVGHAEVTMSPTEDIPSAWPANCTTAQTVFCGGNCLIGVKVEFFCRTPP